MSATAQTTRLHVAGLLRRAWPRNTAKHAAGAAGLSVRTAQAWVAERFTPSAETLLLMAHRNDQLRAALMHALAEAHENEATSQVVLPLEGTKAARQGAPTGDAGSSMARARGPAVTR